MKVNFTEVDIRLSSRPIPAFDGSERNMRYFIDKDNEVWLNAEDLGMSMIGKPNTCGNCIKWHGCSVKDRNICPGDDLPSRFNPEVTSEERIDAIRKSCQHTVDQLKELGLGEKNER